MLDERKVGVSDLTREKTRIKKKTLRSEIKGHHERERKKKESRLLTENV
jgi:hypothetical protein